MASIGELPKELVEKLLLDSSYEEIVKFSSTCKKFSQLSFFFWSQKAEKDFGIPNWYFNLYCNGQDSFINREISGKERYLEIWRMKDPFTCQNYLSKEDRLSEGRDFFNRFSSMDIDKMRSHIESVPIQNLQIYLEKGSQVPALLSYTNLDLVETELIRRGEKITPRFEHLEKVKDALATADKEFLDEYFSATLAILIRDKRAISDFLDIVLFHDLEGDQLIAFFESVYAIYPREEIVVRFLCQLIRNGNVKFVDEFLLLLKEKEIDILRPEIIALFTSHHTGRRTIGDLISLSSFYSNNFELYEHFSDLRIGPNQVDQLHSFLMDYRPLNEQITTFFLIFGYLQKRDPVQFFQIAKAENCFDEFAVQSLVTLTGHTDAIRLMFRNFSPKSSPLLAKICSGDPSLKRQLVETVGKFEDHKMLNDIELPLLQTLASLDWLE